MPIWTKARAMRLTLATGRSPMSSTGTSARSRGHGIYKEWIERWHGPGESRIRGVMLSVNWEPACNIRRWWYWIMSTNSGVRRWDFSSLPGDKFSIFDGVFSEYEQVHSRPYKNEYRADCSLISGAYVRVAISLGNMIDCMILSQ